MEVFQITDDQIQDAINAVGALAELLGLFRDALYRNHFSDDDVLYLCGVYLEATMR